MGGMKHGVLPEAGRKPNRKMAILLTSERSVFSWLFVISTTILQSIVKKNKTNMIETKNNFLSIITIGSFNPAILTPDFLAKENIFISKAAPRGETSPVLSHLEFGNVSLVVELERFQIKHMEVDSFKNSPVISIITGYLKTLKYTPIATEGINFNIDMMNYSDSDGLLQIFNNPIKEIINYVEKADEYLIDVKAKVTSDKEEAHIINCKYNIDEGISISINLRKADLKDRKIVLNYNYEVKNIKSDKDRINIIPDNYTNILTRFIDFIKKFKE